MAKKGQQISLPIGYIGLAQPKATKDTIYVVHGILLSPLKKSLGIIHGH